MKRSFGVTLALTAFAAGTTCLALSPSTSNNNVASRRAALGWLGQATAAVAFGANAVDVDDYLKTGGVSMPMGVSGQGGKMKPETGVVLRDGSEISRDPRNGDVLAEILLKSASGEKVPVLASFSAPWPLATGSNFDIECRDVKTGDGAYLAVSEDVRGKKVSDLSSSFFQDQLFSSTGRFSFYGQPTDVKIKTVSNNGDYRVMDVSFSILSQSTGAEVPRKAKVVASIPEGSSQAVMLVGSSSAARWNKGADKAIASTIESFRAVPAPRTSMRIRAKESS